MAFISPKATIGDNCYVGAFAYIGENVVIGENTQIYPHTVIEDGVKIGNGCILYPNVTIYKECKLGNNVTIHAGTVIGADGFGFAPNTDGYDKIPQIGIVTIEDNVEIGANSCVDRSTMGTTIIRKGVKLDNLVQIAHNVEVGENTVMSAQTGVAGSTKLAKAVCLEVKSALQDMQQLVIRLSLVPSLECQATLKAMRLSSERRRLTQRLTLSLLH